MGKYIIHRGNQGQYYFTLQADNGQTFLTSEDFRSMAACQLGIDAVKSNATDEYAFEDGLSEEGKCFFLLKAFHGHFVIGKSEMYENSTLRDFAIKAVREHANRSVIEEE